MRYDPRYEVFFTNPATLSEALPQVDLTEADQMCRALTSLPNISSVRPFVVIEPSGMTVRSSGDEISRLIKSLETKNLIKTDARLSRRILLITSPIEATRAFLSFRNQDLNASLITANSISDSRTDLSKQCPWPIGKQFAIKPQYFLFSAQSFVQSERAWTEVKELVFYTLRFWLRPPLTDERAYYPRQTL